MPPLRILAVGNMYPPHHQGGYELVWRSTTTRAREDGHAVRILTTIHREPDVPEVDEANVHRTLRWYWDWERHAFPRLSVRDRVALERANAAELARHLDAFRPDVVAWWSMGHMSLSMIESVRRRGLPSVFSIHNDWLVYAWEADQWTRVWGSRPPLYGRIAERLAGVPSRVRLDGDARLLFNSDHTLRRAADHGIDVTSAEVIHPGIEPRFLRSADPRPWRWRLLYAGRIDRQKGVDTALEALAHLPATAELTILGTGDARFAAELVERARAAGDADRVRFAGFGAPERVWAAYAESDAVLFPVRWAEPWGLVPLEAMGVGRPVIATARGGAAEFLRDGDNALTIAPDDPVGLARAVRRLAGDAPLRARLRAGGLATAAAHTAAGFDAATVAAIESAAAGA